MKGIIEAFSVTSVRNGYLFFLVAKISISGLRGCEFVVFIDVTVVWSISYCLIQGWTNAYVASQG